MEAIVKVRVKHGLHARAAAEFVKLAASFRASSPKIIKGAKEIDARSILAIMSASISEGEEVKLVVSGEREKEAFEALKNYLEQKEESKDEAKFSGEMIFKGLTFGRIEIHRGINLDLNDEAGGEKDMPVFESALEYCKQKLLGLRQETTSKLGEENAALFGAHAMLISDEMFANSVREKIKSGKSASDAVVLTGREWSAKFLSLNDPIIRERAADIEDICKRLYININGLPEEKISQNSPCILVTKELSPSETAQIDKKMILGIVSQEGGATSHFAILVGSLGIPAISGIEFDKISCYKGFEGIIDGANFIVSPLAETKEIYEQKRIETEKESEELKLLKNLPAKTRDGREFQLWANISNSGDVENVFEHGGSGVGLFRTEFLFMNRLSPPSEEEQFIEYSSAVKKMNGHPIVIRTLDCGGDKSVPYLMPQVAEKNPFLGLRGVRICLKEKQLFKTQLCALLRASAFGDLRILIPMISNLNDILETKKIVQESVRRLSEHGTDFNKHTKIGIMIEVPSAAIEAATLARHVDFFSIGSNDLIQYTLAADRTNPNVSQWGEGLDPAVIRLMKITTEAAQNAGIDCGICGELAGDAAALKMLVEMGFSSLSMSAAKIPHIKKALLEM